MNTNNATPPIIIKNLPYNERCFTEIVSNMQPEHIYSISMEVWVEEEGGKCCELLRSGLSGNEFDELAKSATRLILTGPSTDLCAIGVA